MLLLTPRLCIAKGRLKFQSSPEPAPDGPASVNDLPEEVSAILGKERGVSF